jgi:hypothetical protein
MSVSPCREDGQRMDLRFLKKESEKRLEYGQGLHSSTFQLNVSALSGIEGAYRGDFGGCLGGVKGYQGVWRVCFVFQPAQVELKSGRV